MTQTKSPLGAWFERHPNVKSMDLAHALRVGESQVSRWRGSRIPRDHMLAIERWTAGIDSGDAVTPQAWAEFAEAQREARQGASAAAG